MKIYSNHKNVKKYMKHTVIESYLIQYSNCSPTSDSPTAEFTFLQLYIIVHQFTYCRAVAHKYKVYDGGHVLLHNAHTDSCLYCVFAG